MIGIDLDGTILNSSYRHKKVLYDTLLEFGCGISYDQLDDFIEFKRNGGTTLNYLLNKQSIGIKSQKQVQQMNEMWIENIEKADYLSLDVLYEDSLASLEKLKYLGELVLVTARSNENGVINQLDKLGISPYFRHVFVVSPFKHASRLKASVTTEMDLECIIGDTETDHQWAQETNTSFFALHRGFRNKTWWEKRGVTSFASLLSITDHLITN